MILRPQPLTAEAFAPFGEVIEVAGVKAQWINQGQTRKFPQLAQIEPGADGRVNLSIYRSQPIELPFRIKRMERHPLASQAFYPLHGRPFPILVSPCDIQPGADTIQAFLSNGRQGVNIRAGVWHHYQLSLERESDYIVIDRLGPASNLEEVDLLDEVLLVGSEHE